MRKFSSTLFLSSSLAVLLSAATLSMPAHAQEMVCNAPIVADTEPPPLPDYDQPPPPAPDYLWTPGYWAWSSDEEDYYWVPGTWVLPPQPGLLWTPGYWAWAGGTYLFHPGYWAYQVGFYGGIYYGYGYTGDGYYGGYWNRGHFFYNRTVNNISNTNITNVYEKTVNVNRPERNLSFNGGRNGVQARPTTEQKALAKEPHFAATQPQNNNANAASKDKSFFSKDNQGKPAVGATAHPAEFKGPGVTATGVQPGPQGGQPGVEEHPGGAPPVPMMHEEHPGGAGPQPNPGAHPPGPQGAHPERPVEPMVHEKPPQPMPHPEFKSAAPPHPQEPAPHPRPVPPPHPAAPVPHPPPPPHPAPQPHPAAAPHPAPHPPPPHPEDKK